MAENCTIYCKIKNIREVAQLIHSHYPASLSNSAIDQWDSLIVHGDDGSLRVTTKAFRERGDNFCRLLLSTCAFIEGVSDADAEVKKHLTSHVESCELVLGVVAEPAFDSDKRYHAVVFAIAKALDGIIFNGQEMLNANGETLLAAA